MTEEIEIDDEVEETIRRIRVYDNLRKELLQSLYDYFAPYAGDTTYTKHLTAMALAKDILSVISTHAFIYHVGEREDLEIVYRDEEFKATSLLKDIVTFVLDTLRVEITALSHILQEVIYFIRAKAYIPREKITYLKNFLVTRNHYVFIRSKGEFMRVTPAIFLHFTKLFPQVLSNRVIKGVLADMERWIQNGEVGENEDIQDMSGELWTVQEGWDELISLLPFPFRINVEYDPGARAPQWQKFLDEVVDKKFHTALKRYCGYILHPSLPWHKMAVLVGEGSNGKSVFLNTVQGIFGKRHCSHVAVQDLNSRFSPSSMEDKLLNVFGDLPAKTLHDTGRLKMVTGGDYIPLEKKFKDPYSGKITVKHFFSANLLPQTKDQTYAFYRRWLIFQFPNQFEGDKEDPFLIEKLKKEKSGIFNWILEGYKELTRYGNFGYGKSVEEVSEIYDFSSDTLKQFVSLYVEEGNTNDIITKDDFYAKYTAYCKEHNLTPRSKTHVSRHLKEHIKVEASRQRINKEEKRVWVGIICDYEIKEEQETGEEEEDRETEEEQGDTVVVRALENFSFAGTDRDYYVNKEDVLALPRRVAKILIKAGKLEVIK